MFLLGAGFSRAAQLPLAGELLDPVVAIVEALIGFGTSPGSHLSSALDRFNRFITDVDPGRPFDVEDFGAWLDWEDVLKLDGTGEQLTEYGDSPGLQLRWGIGHLLNAVTPRELPAVYLDFVRQLHTTDCVLTLNYDLLLERALEEVGVPYRRFPGRFSEVREMHSVWDLDEPEEVRLFKLHGSLDWTYWPRPGQNDPYELQSLVDGPRPEDDPFSQIAVIPRESLPSYYSSGSAWYQFPTMLLPPSTAKPLGGSPLAGFWDGTRTFAYMLGGLTVIGCSLPRGDPYVLQLVHHVATDYASGRPKGDVSWRQHRMHVVDLCADPSAEKKFRRKFAFMDPDQTDFHLEGFDSEAVAALASA